MLQGNVKRVNLNGKKNQTNQHKRDQLTLRQSLTGRARKISSQSRLHKLHWLQEAGKKTKSWWEKGARHNHILGQSFILHCASLLRISSLLISRRIFPVTRMTYADSMHRCVIPMANKMKSIRALRRKVQLTRSLIDFLLKRIFEASLRVTT